MGWELLIKPRGQAVFQYLQHNICHRLLFFHGPWRGENSEIALMISYEFDRNLNFTIMIHIVRQYGENFKVPEALPLPSFLYTLDVTCFSYECMALYVHHLWSMTYQFAMPDCALAQPFFYNVYWSYTSCKRKLPISVSLPDCSNVIYGQ